MVACLAFLAFIAHFWMLDRVGILGDIRFDPLLFRMDADMELLLARRRDE